MTPAEGLLVELADTVKRLLDPLEQGRLEAAIARFLDAIDPEAIERHDDEKERLLSPFSASPGKIYSIGGRKVSRDEYMATRRAENNPRLSTAK